jgi:hypothetical protein
MRDSFLTAWQAAKEKHFSKQHHRFAYLFRMPGVLGYGWHESNRGEYLAQYFLSALGVSTPVLRQEDIGADFFCALAHEDNKRLTFHSPFMVQHGSAASKDFVYGDIQKNESGGWMKLNGFILKSCPFFYAPLIERRHVSDFTLQARCGYCDTILAPCFKSS